MADRGRRDTRSQFEEDPSACPISRSSSYAAASSSYHGHGGDTASHTHTTSPEVKKANRNSFGAPKRKPVPVYDADTTFSSTSSANRHSPPSVSPLSPLSSSPGQASLFDDAASLSRSAQSHRSPTTVGHYSTRHANAPARPGEGSGLAHKSSFGPGGVLEGTPLHLLVPDMPLNLAQRR